MVREMHRTVQRACAVAPRWIASPRERARARRSPGRGAARPTTARPQRKCTLTRRQVLTELHALEVFDRLRDRLFRYYDTPFSIADKRVQAERRTLLDADGVTYREPWLEVIPEYRLSRNT